MNPTRHFHPVRLVAWSAAVLVLALAPGRGVHATPTDDRAVMQAECGGCHLAYPAKLMARADWGQVLGRLERHYGVDATLDEASLAAVARALGARPGTPATASAALPRITASPWFRDEHDELGTQAWRRPAVRSAANCDACHPRAASGEFDDDRVSVPR